MEFMAIVDAKARAPSGCAAVGIYENGDLGVAARQVDKQLEGLITRLLGSGDFAAKLGDTLMLPLPAGSAASRLLLIGLGTRAAFGRKQYRKAMLCSCAGSRQDRRRRRGRLPRHGAGARTRHSVPGAHRRGSVLLSGVQDP